MRKKDMLRVVTSVILGCGLVAYCRLMIVLEKFGYNGWAFLIVVFGIFPLIVTFVASLIRPENTPPCSMLDGGDY